MNDITALTKLRIELSNPAIGSKDHLRKLSLSLIDELEDSRAQVGRHEDFIREQDRLIRDLKHNLHASMQRTVTVKLPDSFYPDGDIELPLVMNEYQVIEALVAAGCKPVAVCPRCKRELDLSVKHDGTHYCHSAAGIQVIEGEQQ